MKRMWFQFVRKDTADGAERTNEKETLRSEESPSHDPKRSVGAVHDKSGEEQQKSGEEQQNEMTLRLAGDIWVYPAGHYKPVVISGQYKELDDTARSVKMFPAGLNLDIGEMRRLDGHLTRMRQDTFDVMESDLPLTVRGERRSALVSLFVGELIHDVEALSKAHRVAAEYAHAYGTALFRTVVVQGYLCEEPFRFRLLQLDRFQLVQGEMGWTGSFFQCVNEEVPGAAGRALLRHIKSAATAEDPLSLIRRAAQRHMRIR